MSATVEYSIPFELATPLGTIPFNSPLYGGSSGPYALLDQAKCSMSPGPLRVVVDDVPQGHGSILHKEFKKGYSAHLAFELWEAVDQPLCGADLVDAWDWIMTRFNSLVNPSSEAVNTGNTQLRWTPTGKAVRMIDRVEASEWIAPEHDGTTVLAGLDLHSPLPYALDQTQELASLGATLTNLGSSEMFPVFKIIGPVTSTVTITNTTTGLKIVYNPALVSPALNIAAGHYAELSTFTGTVFLDGNSTNLLPAIDFETTDFFSLVPGANVLTKTGPGTVEILWQSAWA